MTLPARQPAQAVHRFHPARRRLSQSHGNCWICWARPHRSCWLSTAAQHPDIISWAGLGSTLASSGRQQDLVLVPVPASSTTSLAWLDACLHQLRQQPAFQTHVITVLLFALDNAASLLPAPGGACLSLPARTRVRSLWLLQPGRCCTSCMPSSYDTAFLLHC